MNKITGIKESPGDRHIAAIATHLLFQKATITQPPSSIQMKGPACPQTSNILMKQEGSDSNTTKAPTEFS